MINRLISICVLTGLFLIGSCSKSNDATPAKTPPAVPIATAASAVSQTTFSAVWNAVSGATDYRLDVSADNFTTFVSGYNNKTVATFSDVVSGLNASTTYKYRVRSSNADGISANSNEITVTTTANPAPAAPVATAASVITQTGFTASWNAVTGATDYRLDVSADNYTTFVSGYNNKTVTGTSAVITGLTAGTAYKYRLRSSNANGISANSNDIAVTTTAAITTNGSATLGGTTFTATTSKATDTGAGLELTLADASNKITLSLSDKTAGTYSAVNSSTGGRTEALNFSISILKDGVIYNGVTGSLVITANTDGTFSATFDGTLKSSSGTTLSMSSGKLLNFSVSAAPTTGCRITSITATYPTGCDGAGSINLFYNADGKISKIISPDGSTGTFTYDLTGKLIAASSSSTAGTETIELIYTGNVLSSYKDKEVTTFNGSTSISNTTYTISYSAGGAVTSVAYTDTGTYPSSGTKTVTLTNGNLSVYKDASTYSGITSINEYDYSNFDTKKNPWALMASLTGTPFSFAYEGGMSGFFILQSLSTNNPGAFQRIGDLHSRSLTYTYNAQNYPSKIVYDYSALESGCSVTYNITYSGCQ